MPDLPRQSGEPEERTQQNGQVPETARHRLRTVVWVVLAVAVLVAFVVLHLSGVLGPGQH